MNPELCAVQEEAVSVFGLETRGARVVRGDVAEAEVEVARADVVLLHNPFEFFLTPAKCRPVWDFLRRTVPVTQPRPCTSGPQFLCLIKTVLLVIIKICIGPTDPRNAGFKLDERGSFDPLTLLPLHPGRCLVARQIPVSRGLGGVKCAVHSWQLPQVVLSRRLMSCVADHATREPREPHNQRRPRGDGQSCD
jgi:hypothetical protein